MTSGWASMWWLLPPELWDTAGEGERKGSEEKGKEREGARKEKGGGGERGGGGGREQKGRSGVGSESEISKES